MRKQVISILLLIFLISIQVWFIYITFHFEYRGGLLQKNSENEWMVIGFDTDASTKTSKIHVGDIILEVDGKNPNKHSSVKKWATLEQADKVTVLRNGNQIELKLKDATKPIYDFISLFGEIISLFLSALIFFKIPNSKSARLLSLVFLMTGVTFMAFSSSYRGDALAKVLISNLVIGLPLVFLHFLILFFREKSKIQIRLKWLNGLYGIVALNTTICLSYLTPLNTYAFYRIDYSMILLFFLVGLLLNLFMFIYIYFKYRKINSSVSQIIKIVWASLFLSCAPLAFFSFIPILATGNPLIDPLYAGYFVILFPLSFCYLIVTKQLFDIHNIMRRILYTTLVSMIPSAILLGFLAFIFSKEATLQNLSFCFLFIVTMISFLLYISEFFSNHLEAIIFPQKFRMKLTLNKIVRNLTTTTSFRELKEIILLDIINALQVYGGAIVFQYQNDIETIGEGEINLEEIEKGLIDNCLDESKYSVIEINRHEEHTSYFVFTRKKATTLLGIEEKQWLDLIISYLAVSLENVYLIRKLTLRIHELASQIPNEQAGHDLAWLRKSLFALQERERFRIATDLHDTIIQDIVLIRRKLIAYIDSHTSDQPVQEVIKHLEMLNESLRQSCFELNPYLLQRAGLTKTLEAAIDLDRGNPDLDIHFYTEGTALIEMLDLESKKHLFRIFQELMNNAKKHSQATEVTIRLAAEGSSVCLSYRDNGIGLDPTRLDAETRIHTLVHSGLGLEQMKSRVLLLGGQLDWRSPPGTGVELTIRVPLTEQKGWVV